MKAKVECVQKAARPATGTYQLSMEHFPWRPQLKLAYIHQSRVHLSVPQSWDSQCLQTHSANMGTTHCMGHAHHKDSWGLQQLSRILRASQHPDFNSQKVHPYQDDLGPKAWTLLGKKSPSCHLHCVNLTREKNAIIQSITNSNWETLLMRKGTRLHMKDTMCFY